MKKNIAVALDGPSGSGKSTVAGMVAKELGLVHLDTGAIYRTLGYKALITNTDIDNHEKIEELLNNTSIKIEFDKSMKQKMLLDGEDVTNLIREPKVAAAASKVAAIGAVRSFLLDLQRNIAEKYSVILDGRDIGSCVLPNADVKIFLTASKEKRAERRLNELKEKGMDSEYSLEQIIAQIEERDYRDSHRDIAPLTVAKDAVIVDSSELNIEQTLQKIIELIRSAE